MNWKDIIAIKKAGRLVTEAALYEKSQCRDGSKFVVIKDHPLGPRTMRIWP